MTHEVSGDAYKYLEFEAGGSGPPSGKNGQEWRLYVDQHGNIHLKDSSNNDYLAVKKSGTSIDLEGATISNGDIAADQLRAGAAEWWRTHDLNVFGAGVGGSPTLTAPAATTLGGYQLDANTEILYFSSRVGSDWDAASNPEVKFLVTLNTAATASTTLNADLVAYIGGADTSAVAAQSLAFATTLGAQSAGYTTAATFTVDYDSSSAPVAAGDVITMKLSLDTSGIGDVTVNHGRIRYQSLQVDEEI